MKKRVLLSIHPEYANAIFAGEKGFEFRRVIFKEDVSEVVVYATSPISRVIGCFKIEEIYQDTPGELWVKTEARAGVTREMFDSYFKDRVKAFAIKVSEPTRFSRPQPLSKYLPSNTPPQSFCYI
ncbi:ASCH domain-containing protein [Burkholderia stagnalis]|uniref:ASCH domain-containing protein n=1 Tax=Burkholderia lata (strain ATCC 17760 / DSM 23089 / LMG 22485 / NCIMB 9086 / R18194 / 383) TaxID=482957 RepID=Q39PG6_BURL3|nr:conserved hypothetical protein [Burkholderia lata]RQQ19576.1 ASCH domain-containing protein [Burkholderia stagnalis]RQS05639.1 ASCH domain-containing protein [Burkholderia sp. Bp9002]RQQ21680.1 ASCH domain-containing protein [Burkholderia stagnalis]RQQ40099.1 ASCH domain-containing protein [Burkholderia stagnalis]